MPAPKQLRPLRKMPLFKCIEDQRRILIRHHSARSQQGYKTIVHAPKDTIPQTGTAQSPGFLSRPDFRRSWPYARARRFFLFLCPITA